MRSRSPLADALQAADFNEVELVGLTGADDNDPDESDPVLADERNFGEYGVTWSRLLDAEDRSRLHALLIALPDGTSARCHTPPFGLVLGTPPRGIHVSLCFRCNNAIVDRELVAFDSGSRQAQALLAFLRSHVPKDRTSAE